MAQNIARLATAENTREGTAHRFSQEWLAPKLVVVTLAAIVASLVGERLGASQAVLLSLGIVAYLAGGFYGAKSALESLRAGALDVDLLMVLAALGAAFIGQWREGAILLFLFSLSNVLQDYAIDRSRRAIRDLFQLYPKTAKVKRGDSIEELSIGEIKSGDIVLIEPGERIPVDGLVIAGNSTVDESPITGESMPVDKLIGDEVFAGALNKQGILDVRSLRSTEQTTLSRIIKLVEEAQGSKAPTERFLYRFEQVYAKLIIFGVLLFIVLPPALGLSDFHSNFYRAMVLMTVASPCALVISVPSAFISAIAAAARRGLLFKGGASLEKLAAVKVFAFDKTGTLTLGQPAVTDVVLAQGVTEEELLRAAASIEARSEHPLARAIVEYAAARDLRPAPIQDFAARPGQGVRALLDGQEVQVGRVSQLRPRRPLPGRLDKAQRRLEGEGKTVAAVARADKWLGLIALADEARGSAPGLVADLKRLGIQVVMLTGDNRRVAESIAARVGIDQVYAELLPQEKAQALRRFQEEIGPVVMVGDGINDAPALAVADVGIAMGGAGADVALETSDVALMGDRLQRLMDAVQLSRRARRVVWQNIGFSLMVIVLLVLGVIFAQLSLPLGVLGHEGSTVIVVLNGLLSLLVLPELLRRRMRGIGGNT